MTDVDVAVALARRIPTPAGRDLYMQRLIGKVDTTPSVMTFRAWLITALREQRLWPALYARGE
jgi:hypothetical protein